MPPTAYEKLPESLKIIRTRPLFVLRLDVKAPVSFGETPNGVRRIAAVASGVFEGERLSGKVLDGGSDWQIVRQDGVTTLDVRLSLQTHDGALIAMTYRGLRHGPIELIQKLERGEAVNPADYYFRINPLFETASPQYAWLNCFLAIGTGHRDASGPTYSVFEVL